MADVNATELTQETGSTLDGTEQFVMFDSAEGKRATLNVIKSFILPDEVTGVSKGDSTNQAPSFGGTFKALFVTINAKGLITALTDHTVTLPDNNLVAIDTTAASGTVDGDLYALINGNSWTSDVIS